MSDWDTENRRARDQILEAFAAAGFDVRSAERVEGDIHIAGRTPVPVDITIPDGFPYQGPRVKPIDGSSGFSWHADPDGHLCLWADKESGDLPWQTVDAIVGRVQVWFEKDAAGWPDDAPDLDLERYWPRTDGLVLYDDLDGIVGRVARVDRRHGVWRVKAGPAPKQGKQLAAAVLDVGELVKPLRSFNDILERAGGLRPRLERDVPAGRIQVLVVRYWRAGTAAVVALLVTNKSPMTLKAATAADTGDATLHLRGGQDRDVLAGQRVAIVGLGAIGSQVADLLARAGVGRFTFVDFDIVRPGNCIRHLATLDQVGQPKVHAVRDLLVAARLVPAQAIDARQDRLGSPGGAADLLLDHDLVVDASANGTATRLLLDGAEHLDRTVVSVCLVHDGRVARVDRAPLSPGEAHAISPPAPLTAMVLYEGGCGDPVSPAPMWAATTAATRAVAVVVDRLTGRHQYPASIVDVLVPGNEPYDNVGTLQ